MNRNFAYAVVLLTSTAMGGAAFAQAVAEDAGALASDDIIVTATKQSNMTVQKVPLAITAFGAEQLSRMQIRTVDNLSNSVPNIALGNGSVAPGTINFSIRGLGTAGSTPSSDPQVGLFVDGVFVASIYGGLMDTFDLEGVEVLRGPQGVLFGKNVTAGAVLLRTTTPKNELYADVRASIETGLVYTGSAVISGPIIKDILAVKVAGYYSKDKGYFYDSAQNEPLGGGRTWIGRAAARFTPNDSLEFIARYEKGKMDSSQGVALLNDLKYPTGTKMESGGGGYSYTHWSNQTIEANWDVGPVRLTNIAGWRKVDYDSRYDVDGLVGDFYDPENGFRQNQFSNEFRAAGAFGNFDLTAGLYYFTQYMQYVEGRNLGNGTFLQYVNGGGKLKQRTYGAFGAFTWHVSDVFAINAGGRYTKEKKHAFVRSFGGGLIGASTPPCDYQSVHGDLQCSFDFEGRLTSNSFTPKIGFQWTPSPRTQVYGNWAKGLRSGGFNFRNTVPGAPAGPYDDETQYAIELGLKTDLDDGRVRLNVALFRSKLHDLQRDRTISAGQFGTGQFTGNIADATYQGVEVETTVRVSEQLVLNGFLGITDADYDRVSADLNSDGLTNINDKNLKLTRVYPISYGVGATYQAEVGTLGKGEARINYAFKDKSFFTDNNLTPLRAAKVLDGSISLTTFQDRVTFSVYGKNLLDRRIESVHVALPASLGGNGTTAGFTTIEKGRVIGGSVRFKFGG